MMLYVPHSIFHLARLLYVRPETFGPILLCLCLLDPPSYIVFNCRLATAGRAWGIDQKKQIICTEFLRRKTGPAGRGGGGADDMSCNRPGR